MVSRSRATADDELSAVVRRRLEALLAEIPPRRAASPAAGQSAGPARYAAEPDTQPDAEIGPPPAATSAPRRPFEPATDDPVGRHATGDLGAARPSSTAGGSGAAARPAEADLDEPSRRDTIGRLAAWSGGFRVRQFVRDHLVVVGIVVLTGCLWAGYSLFQARTTPVALAAADPSVQVSVATPAPSPSATVLVHVLGEVRRPGVVSLPEGARVQDAIVAAGGLTARAAPGDLNLAAEVGDGSQLVIGRRGSEVRSSGTSGGSPAAAALVNLNAATLEQLDSLPGVGPVTAQKILAWREAHQRFRSVAELQEVDGIGPKTYAEIAPRVRV